MVFHTFLFALAIVIWHYATEDKKEKPQKEKRPSNPGMISKIVRTIHTKLKNAWRLRMHKSVRASPVIAEAPRHPQLEAQQPELSCASTVGGHTEGQFTDDQNGLSGKSETQKIATILKLMKYCNKMMTRNEKAFRTQNVRPCHE